jgi:hypothetical protein
MCVLVEDDHYHQLVLSYLLISNFTVSCCCSGGMDISHFHLVQVSFLSSSYLLSLQQ